MLNCIESSFKMRSIIGRIILKIIILIGCIGCVITKALTDQKARQVFLRNQKLSREWGLQHNLFWNSSGNAFANITYGGFTLITTLMLISRCIDAKSSPSLVEKIFLTVGMLCFCTMGGVVFAAYDQVPDDLHENAIILGCLSFFIAFLMLIDLSDPMARHITDQTQTDLTFTNQTTLINHIPNHFPNSAIPMMNHNHHDKQETKEINRDNQQVILTTVDDLDRLNTNNALAPTTTTTANIHSFPSNNIGMYQQQQPPSPPQHQHSIDTIDNMANGNHHINGDRADFVQKRLPTAQEPVFEKLLLPEKLRPHKKWIPSPKTNTSKVNYSHPHQNTESNNIPHRQYSPQQQVHQIYGRIFESTSSLPPPQPPSSWPMNNNNNNNQPNLPHASHPPNYHHTKLIHDQNGHTSRDNNSIRTAQQQNIPSKYQPNNFRQYSYDNNQQKQYYDGGTTNKYNNQFQEKPMTQYRSPQGRPTSCHRQSGGNNLDNDGHDDDDEGYHLRCDSGNDSRGHKKNRPTTPVQPGFVAYAAKIWDNRAKKLNATSLNTIV